jgi:hypothetical protein
MSLIKMLYLLLMKNKQFLFLLVGIILSSCKKEEEPSSPTSRPALVYKYAYFKGVIIDSTTGMPSNNAVLYGRYPHDTTGLTGEYLSAIIWGGDARYPGYDRPADSLTILVTAANDNLFGTTEFKAWQLIENDTITLPVIYLNPAGYVKVHAKDTSGFGALASYVVKLKCSEIASMLPYPFDGYQISSSSPSWDVTNVFRVYSYRTTTVSFFHYNNTLHPPDIINNLIVAPNDTSLVDIFY